MPTHLVAYAFAWSLPVPGLLSHLLVCLAWLVAWSLRRLVFLFLKDSSKFLGGRRLLPKLFSDLGWFNKSNDYRGVIVRFWYFEGALGDFSFAPTSVRRLFDMLILELFGWRCLLGIGVSSFIHKAVLGRLQTPADFIPCTAGHLPSSFVEVNFLIWRHCERDISQKGMYIRSHCWVSRHEQKWAISISPFLVWNCRMGACWRLEFGAEAVVTCSRPDFVYQKFEYNMEAETKVVCDACTLVGM